VVPPVSRPSGATREKATLNNPEDGLFPQGRLSATPIESSSEWVYILHEAELQLSASRELKATSEFEALMETGMVVRV
jgi:hypothetical protein